MNAHEIDYKIIGDENKITQHINGKIDKNKFEIVNTLNKVSS